MATLDNFGLTQLTLVSQDLVSTGEAEKKFLGNIMIRNTSSSNVVVTMWIQNTTDTPTSGSGSNEIYSDTIAAGETRKVDVFSGSVLGNSMSLKALASADAVINVIPFGTTET